MMFDDFLSAGCEPDGFKAAEQRYLKLLEIEANSSEDIGEAVQARLVKDMTWIRRTLPRSLFDVAVKLRLLTNPNVGLAVGTHVYDVESLEGVLAFIERQLGGRAP